MEEGTFFEELAAAVRERRRVALAVVVEVAGSAPQRPGAKMLVYEDGTILGRVGGGKMELGVIEQALLALEDERSTLLSLELSKENDSMCGGTAKVYIEPLLPNPELIVAGAGHIGQALAVFAKPLGFRMVLLDSRVEYLELAKERLDGIKAVLIDYADPFQGVDVGPSSCIVVATFGHTHDFNVVLAALKTPARYIGLVGSKSKRAALFDLLQERGFSKEDIARIRTPVGLPIGAVTPQEIAISILAEIIQLRRSYDLPKLNRASSCSRAVPAHGKSQAPA
jgi:xanthine dehydrogenase accessory factor